MTTQELLSHFYQAYKSNDEEYAEILKARFPEECQELLQAINRTDSIQDFKNLLGDATK